MGERTCSGCAYDGRPAGEMPCQDCGPNMIRWTSRGIGPVDPMRTAHALEEAIAQDELNHAGVIVAQGKVGTLEFRDATRTIVRWALRIAAEAEHAYDAARVMAVMDDGTEHVPAPTRTHTDAEAVSVEYPAHPIESTAREVLP